MIIKISLILSLIIQLTAIVIAFSLIRRTRNNIAWWLLLAVLFVIAVKLFIELFNLSDPGMQNPNYQLTNLLSLVISLLILFGLVFIRRIVGGQKKDEELREERETEVLSAIVKAEENERARFAKELHDGLGPLLSSIKMSVSTIKKQMGSDSDMRIIDNTEKLIDESIYTIKEISNNISPHILNNFGLNKALQSFINKIQISNPINIILNSNLEEKRYSYNVEVVFYRVICELINNTLKHASARKITIDFFEDDNELLLEYIDDGIGFLAEKAELSGTGMGLANIRSRINSLNGSYQITSRKGKGVCFTIKVKIV
jgi:signal transduction histidine kinase